jgi:DNA-binding winged helix-turn-helix (wHTH) protein
MAILEKPSSIFRFGAFEVNLRAREVRKYGIQVKLPGQPFEILAILLQRSGDVVTREELHQQLWSADTFVDFEHGLNNAVKKLRAALGDSAEHPLYVETLARVGYRFIAPVEGVNGAQTVAPRRNANGEVGNTEPARRRIPRMVVGIGLALAATALVAFFRPAHHLL